VAKGSSQKPKPLTMSKLTSTLGLSSIDETERVIQRAGVHKFRTDQGNWVVDTAQLPTLRKHLKRSSS
jgi:hypothetical protein